MFEKRGKKGISPLIATVLLIAFAVSIGTMIMSLGKPSQKVGDCDQVGIEVQTIASKPMLCYDTLNTNINFALKNTGSVEISRIKVVITSPDFSHDELPVEGSNIAIGNQINKNVKYVKSGMFKVELVPLIISGGKEKSCLNKSVVAETIGPCNWAG